MGRTSRRRIIRDVGAASYATVYSHSLNAAPAAGIDDSTTASISSSQTSRRSSAGKHRQSSGDVSDVLAEAGLGGAAEHEPESSAVVLLADVGHSTRVTSRRSRHSQGVVTSTTSWNLPETTPIMRAFIVLGVIQVVGTACLQIAVIASKSTAESDLGSLLPYGAVFLFGSVLVAVELALLVSRASLIHLFSFMFVNINISIFGALQLYETLELESEWVTESTLASIAALANVFFTVGYMFIMPGLYLTLGEVFYFRFGPDALHRVMFIMFNSLIVTTYIVSSFVILFLAMHCTFYLSPSGPEFPLTLAAIVLVLFSTFAVVYKMTRLRLLVHTVVLLAELAYFTFKMFEIDSRQCSFCDSPQFGTLLLPSYCAVLNMLLVIINVGLVFRCIMSIDRPLFQQASKFMKSPEVAAESFDPLYDISNEDAGNPFAPFRGDAQGKVSRPRLRFGMLSREFRFAEVQSFRRRPTAAASTSADAVHQDRSLLGKRSLSQPSSEMHRRVVNKSLSPVREPGMASSVGRTTRHRRQRSWEGSEHRKMFSNARRGNLGANSVSTLQLPTGAHLAEV